jgi:DNA mismatch repair protein MutS
MPPHEAKAGLIKDKMANHSSTPMMKQYQEIKGQYPNTLLLYRMGDFYEMFNEDAVTASKVLGLTLTSRNHGGADKTPLAGFPYHALDRYNAKLIKAGFKVAICEQTEDPKLAKGIVKRDVVEVVTAGTSLDPNFLDISKNNYLVCLFPQNEKAGIAIIDLSTGEFRISEQAAANIFGEISRIQPSEILIPENVKQIPLTKKIEKETKTVLTYLEDWRFSHDLACKELLNHFQVASLDGFGFSHLNLAVIAAGTALT